MKSKVLNRFASIAAIGVLLAFFTGCDTTQNTTSSKPTLKVPTYTFTPPNTAPARSAKVTFLLINPRYATTFKYSTVKIFNDFSNSMSADFNQALTAKGYSVRGPYPTYNEVIYSDKKETDLMLQIEIALDVDEPNVSWRRHQTGFGQYIHFYYTFEGSIILSGKVNMTASETMTREKLWSKSIPLEQQNIDIASIFKYDSPNTFNTALAQDPGIANPIVDVLEQFYKSIFSTAWNHLEPQELTPLKAQVDEIRAKSNLIQH